MSSQTSQEVHLNFNYMLGGLLILLLVGPLGRLFASPAVWEALAPVTTGLVISVGSFTMVTGSKARAIGAAFGVVDAVCNWLGDRLNLPVISGIAAVGLLLFCLWAITLSLRQVLMGTRADFNRIIGAVCVYMLMALAWAIVYGLVALSSDGAFDGLSGTDLNSLFPELVYFSFVTLTTLGYGDISPLLPLARALAYLEAVVGQMYLAILIAGLVGAHLSSRR